MEMLKSPFNWFWGLFAIVGFAFIGQYGVPLDELTQRHIGLENARYLSGSGQAHSVAEHGFFGPVLEVIMYAAEQAIYEQPLGMKLALRHGIMFFIFLIAVRAFYFTSKHFARVPNSAGLATLMFACTPWVFAHGMYNTKDTFFLSLLAFVLYFLARFSGSGKWIYLICVGAIAGISATIRLNGIFVLLAILLSFLIAGKTAFSMRMWRIAVTSVFFIVFFVLFYPYLWIVKWKGISELFHYVTSNPWPWDTLAANQDIKAESMPWWYLLAWMGVTIPVLTIILFLVGVIGLLKKRGKFMGFMEWVMVLLFIIPVFYFIVFRPTLYNGWRHLQFIYLPISMLTVYGLNAMLSLKWGQYASWMAAAYSVFILFLWQPYGYAYFNEIYAATAKPCTWDQDYWGLSARQGLQYVASHDTRDSIVISSFTESPELNALMLPLKDQKRFHFVHTQGAGDYEVEVKRGRYFADIGGTVIYTVCPLKDTLVRVVKLK